MNGPLRGSVMVSTTLAGWHNFSIAGLWVSPCAHGSAPPGKLFLCLHPHLLPGVLVRLLLLLSVLHCYIAIYGACFCAPNSVNQD